MFSISAKTKRLDFLVLQVYAPKKSERFLVKGAICYSAPVVGARCFSAPVVGADLFFAPIWSGRRSALRFQLHIGAIYGALLLIAPFQ